MQRSVQYRDWTFAADREQTRAGYITQAAADFASCCASCENFGLALACGLVFPPEIVDLLDEVGIDARKVTEQTEFTETRPGWHLYSGWYHFVGSLETGPDAYVPAGENGWTVLLEPVSEDFSIGFTHRAALIPAEFQGMPLVQLEFTVELPWLLSGPPRSRVSVSTT